MFYESLGYSTVYVYSCGGFLDPIDPHSPSSTCCSRPFLLMDCDAQIISFHGADEVAVAPTCYSPLGQQLMKRGWLGGG